MNKTTVKRWPLWDLPTRLGHGLLILALALAWWSAETQRTDLHQWTGYSILVLVVSRVVWGFIGSTPSRFSSFLRGPAAVFTYFRNTQLKTGEDNSLEIEIAGHNPAGGWSVIVMLLLLFIQAFSGLFNSDDILFNGPFYHVMESEWQDRMGLVHDYAFDALIIFIALHVSAITYYYFKGKNLLTAMIFGASQDRYAEQAPKPTWRWIAALVILAALLWAAVEAAPQPSNQWF